MCGANFVTLLCVASVTIFAIDQKQYYDIVPMVKYYDGSELKCSYLQIVER